MQGTLYTLKPEKGLYRYPPPYEMTKTYRPACSKGWLPPIATMEEPLQIQDSFDMSFVIETHMRNSLEGAA